MHTNPSFFGFVPNFSEAIGAGVIGLGLVLIDKYLVLRIFPQLCRSWVKLYTQLPPAVFSSIDVEAQHHFLRGSTARTKSAGAATVLVK